MKQRIISASRRTDIPAFYGDWFMNRIRAGVVGYVNPFGGQKYLVDLRPESVLCFAFWSKNYAPFLSHLQTLTDMGYRSYFNFTITGLPREFECNLVEADEAVATLRRMADMFSPRHTNWRYDPIVISDRTPFDWHVARFAELASRLRGATERCYFSYAIQYGKVERSFRDFQQRQGVRIEEPDAATRRRLADAMADIADANGMTLYSCCGDALVGGRIRKAHCVDGDVIRSLFAETGPGIKAVPTRKECGCAESTDIGAYDTCPHGCVYCYANINKDKAARLHAEHDPESAFLGYPGTMSTAWLSEFLGRATPVAERSCGQMNLL